MKKKVISILVLALLLIQSCQHEDDKFTNLQPTTEDVDLLSKSLFSGPIQYDSGTDAFNALKEKWDDIKTEPKNVDRKFTAIVISNRSNADLTLSNEERNGVVISPFDNDGALTQSGVSIARGKSIALLAAETVDSQNMKGSWSYKIDGINQYFNIGVDFTSDTDIKLGAEISGQSLLIDPSIAAVANQLVNDPSDDSNALIIESGEANYSKVLFALDKKTVVNSVKDIVDYLASDELGGRFIDTEGYEKAGGFVENKLLDYGIAPYFQTYRDEFSIVETSPGFGVYGWGTESFNVVGVIEGTDPTLANEYVILGAHLDTSFAYDFNTIDGDEIMNGANDNASGVAAVLSIAKHIKEAGNNKRSVIVALFGAEEVGKHGSKHLAKKLKGEGLDLYTMINFDMVGFPLQNQSYSAIVSGYDKSNMAQKINEYSDEGGLVGFHAKAQEFNLFELSDNYPFYTEFMVPSHTISSFVPGEGYSYYHNVNDEASQLDYDFISNLINDIAPIIIKMLNTSTKEIIVSQN